MCSAWKFETGCYVRCSEFTKSKSMFEEERKDERNKDNRIITCFLRREISLWERLKYQIYQIIALAFPFFWLRNIMYNMANGCYYLKVVFVSDIYCFDYCCPRNGIPQYITTKIPAIFLMNHFPFIPKSSNIPVLEEIIELNDLERRKAPRYSALFCLMSAAVNRGRCLWGFPVGIPFEDSLCCGI